jgi:uncharacterized protein YndB with AHSA1/START domain
MSNPDTSQTDPDHPTPAEQIVREVELSAPVDAVWAVLTDPDELAEWLGGEVDLELEPGAAGRVTDPDGTVRQVLVTDVEPGRRLGWHWWSDDDELSSVELVLEPLDDDRSRIRVTETITAGALGPIAPQASVRTFALAGV